MVSWCPFKRFCWLWLMRDSRCGGRLCWFADCEDTHVSTNDDADPVGARMELREG